MHSKLKSLSGSITVYKQFEKNLKPGDTGGRILIFPDGLYNKHSSSVTISNYRDFKIMIDKCGDLVIKEIKITKNQSILVKSDQFPDDNYYEVVNFCNTPENLIYFITELSPVDGKVVGNFDVLFSLGSSYPYVTFIDKDKSAEDYKKYLLELSSLSKIYGKDTTLRFIPGHAYLTERDEFFIYLGNTSSPYYTSNPERHTLNFVGKKEAKAHIVLRDWPSDSSSTISDVLSSDGYFTTFSNKLRLSDKNNIEVVSKKIRAYDLGEFLTNDITSGVDLMNKFLPKRLKGIYKDLSTASYYSYSYILQRCILCCSMFSTSADQFSEEVKEALQQIFNRVVWLHVDRLFESRPDPKERSLVTAEDVSKSIFSDIQGWYSLRNTIDENKLYSRTGSFIKDVLKIDLSEIFKECNKRRSAMQEDIDNLDIETYLELSKLSPTYSNRSVSVRCKGPGKSFSNFNFSDSISNPDHSLILDIVEKIYTDIAINKNPSPKYGGISSIENFITRQGYRYYNEFPNRLVRENTICITMEDIVSCAKDDKLLTAELKKEIIESRISEFVLHYCYGETR